LETVARQAGVDALFQRLRAVDPVAAEAIDPRNVRRVIRALEVNLTTGGRFSDQRLKNPPNYRAFILGLTLARSKLYKRIDARVAWMLANGWVAETRALAAKGYAWSLPALSAIGYKQVGMHLRGEIDLAEAKRLIKRETRKFVRRQSNWFRLDNPSIHWRDVESLSIEQLADEIKTFFSIVE